jgi:hypothetical protein
MCPRHREQTLSPSSEPSSAGRRSGFELGAAGSLERHWQAVGMQTVREAVRATGVGASPVSDRDGTDAEEAQHLLLQVLGRPAQQEARAAESQQPPPIVLPCAMLVIAKNAPQIAIRATKERRSRRGRSVMTRLSARGPLSKQGPTGSDCSGSDGSYYDLSRFYGPPFFRTIKAKRTSFRAFLKARVSDPRRTGRGDKDQRRDAPAHAGSPCRARAARPAVAGLMSPTQMIDRETSPASANRGGSDAHSCWVGCRCRSDGLEIDPAETLVYTASGELGPIRLARAMPSPVSGLVMGILRNLRCRPRVALAAIVAALLAVGGTSATAGTAKERSSRMRQAGCCCPTLPAGGCCCEPGAPAGPSGAPAGLKRTAIRISSTTASVAPDTSCLCRANDPGTPSPRPERRGADGRTDHEPVAIGGALVQDDGVLALVHRPVTPTVSPPHSPPSLRTTRLQI